MENLIDLERRGWTAMSSSKADAVAFYEPLLLHDATMVFPGAVRLSGKAEILDAMDAQPWDSFVLSSPREMALSESARILCYSVTAQREGTEPYVALVSSTYVLRDGNWKLAFHQQTPV